MKIYYVYATAYRRNECTFLYASSSLDKAARYATRCAAYPEAWKHVTIESRII